MPKSSASASAASARCVKPCAPDGVGVCVGGVFIDTTGYFHHRGIPPFTKDCRERTGRGCSRGAVRRVPTVCTLTYRMTCYEVICKTRKICRVPFPSALFSTAHCPFPPDSFKINILHAKDGWIFTQPRLKITSTDGQHKRLTTERMPR